MFSSLTQPNYPSVALGISAERLTAVELQGEGRGTFGIKQAATSDLPSGLCIPSFAEQNIDNAAEFADCIREVAMSAGLLGQKRWSVSLPGAVARTAILTLETQPASKGETEEILNWKAEQSFGSGTMEMRLSTKQINPDRDGRARFLATAIKLAILDEYETVFESLGWHTGLLLPRAVGESNWLLRANSQSDSVLISTQTDGFTAFVFRNGEPAVVRNVTCSTAEVDDEIYRLLMFYNDRYPDSRLSDMLVIGGSVSPERVDNVASEALGYTVPQLRSEDVGLHMPGSTFSFADIAAPSGLAALG
ncbi:MAG TPA: hypothetical protein PKA82_14030 [Pyrinomonadaceae bacterium]|nr:hypothetical protein [Pyrinomonadaceae bacterium]